MTIPIFCQNFQKPMGWRNISFVGGDARDRPLNLPMAMDSYDKILTIVTCQIVHISYSTPTPPPVCPSPPPLNSPLTPISHTPFISLSLFSLIYLPKAKLRLNKMC